MTQLSSLYILISCCFILCILVSWYQFVLSSEAMHLWVSLIALKKLPRANWGWISMCKGTAALCKGTVLLCKGTAVMCKGSSALCKGTAVLC